MKATVKSVLFNQALGSYKVTKLAVINDKGEDKEYNIFTNAKFHNVVAQLVPNDNVEITMEKNGKYWNVADVVKLQGQVSSSGNTGNGGGYNKQGSGDKDIAIARAVALKAAVELYVGMMAAGLTKKTLKPEAAQEEVFALCRRFEGYCTLQDDLSELMVDSAVVGTSPDYNETEFPDA